MHYYQHHIGDFIKDTSFLTNEEVGIYLKLLWLYYDSEKPLPDDLNLLSAKANCRDNKSDLLEILEIFFVLQDGYWHHTRCDNEIAEYHNFIQSKSKAGKASAERRKNINPTPVQQTISECDTNVQLTTNHKPLTTNHIKDIAPPDGVASDLWKDYLKVRNKQKKPITQTAIKGLIREAEKAKLTLSEVIQICAERGWVGFKAEWTDAKQTTKTNTQEWRTNDALMMAKANELGLYTTGLQRYELIQKIDATLRSRGL